MTAGRFDERGVSDVVAFALVFGMVITIVSTTFVFGLGGIEALGDNSQMQTANQQMDAVAAAIEDIHRRGSVARSVEVELDGATLELSDSTVQVAVGSDPLTTHQVGSVELQRDQGIAAYEAGAVFRTDADRTGGVITRGPAVSCTSETAIVSIVELNPDEPISVAGDDSVRLIGKIEDRQVRTEYGGSSITVDVSGLDNRKALTSYFERSGSNWSKSGTEYTCTAQTIVFRKTIVEVVAQR